MSSITAATKRKWENNLKYIHIFFIYKDYQSWSISKLFWIHGKKCLGTIESIQYTIWEKQK